MEQTRQAKSRGEIEQWCKQSSLEPRTTCSAPVAPAEARADADETPCAHALFQQPWWLDAVAPGAWDAAIVTKDGEIVGRLPYVRMRRFGLTILGQPLLTQFLGPWIKPGTGKSSHSAGARARDHERA